MQENMRGWRVKDINPTWERHNQTGRVVRVVGEKVYWVSDIDGEVVVDTISDLQMHRRGVNIMGDIKSRTIKKWKI